MISPGETIGFEASNQVCIKSLIPPFALQQETNKTSNICECFFVYHRKEGNRTGEYVAFNDSI